MPLTRGALICAAAVVCLALAQPVCGGPAVRAMMDLNDDTYNDFVGELISITKILGPRAEQLKKEIREDLKAAQAVHRRGSLETGSPVDPSVVVNVAKSFWDFIKGNKGVVDISTDYAVGIPQGVVDWIELEGWSEPTIEGPFEFLQWNGVGIVLANCTYAVVFQHGGSYNGTGQYLAGFGVVVKEVDVTMTNTVHATVKADDVSNVGTADAPVAAINLDVTFKLEALTFTQQVTHMFFATGNGKFTSKTTPA